MTDPRISVVMATYNRCGALRQAIRSVRRSTLTDWELIVVGDACTDETAACVASFDDARIRFVNLAARCGDQSGPNSHGVTLARGRYVAFLNHDDLYFPGHLAACVAELDSSGADLVWVPCAQLLTEAQQRPTGRFALSGVPGIQGYSPHGGYFASSWAFRREWALRVGPWELPGRSYVAPSQAWLFRAWQMGASLRFLPKVGVILIPSGLRKDSYARDDHREQEWLADWMERDPHCREQILEEAAVTEGVRRGAARLGSIHRRLLRPIHALSMALGQHPESWHYWLRYGRRGSFVRHLRKHSASD